MAISGKTGSVLVSGGTVCAKAWTLDFNADRLDATTFCSDGWKEFIGGLKGATASITSLEYETYDPTLEVAVVLTNDDVTFSGSALINSTVPTPVEGTVEYTYDVQFSGSITVV